MPAGRPTDYKPEYCQEVDEYLKETGLVQMHLPKRVSFARRIGVHKDTINEWAKVHPEFSVAIKKIDDKQEEDLLDIGIFGGKEVNTSVINKVLSANHGYVEKTATDLTSNGKDISPLLVKFIGEEKPDGK